MNGPASPCLGLHSLRLGARRAEWSQFVPQEREDAPVTADARQTVRYERDAAVRRTLGLCESCGQCICADDCRKSSPTHEAGSNTRRWTDAELGDIVRSFDPSGRVSRKKYAAERKTRGGSMPAESSLMRRFGSWDGFLTAISA